MCGIAGIVHRNKTCNVGAEMTAMLQSLKHRGPDSTGYAVYVTDASRAVLGEGPPAHGLEVFDRHVVAPEEPFRVEHDARREAGDPEFEISRISEAGSSPGDFDADG